MMPENCRRKGPDPLVRSLRYLALAGWGLMIAALTVFDRAKPQVQTFFERYYGIGLRTWWNAELTGFIRALLWAGLAVSVLGLVANALRRRRQTDEWRISLWLLLLTSLAGLFFWFRCF